MRVDNSFISRSSTSFSDTLPNSISTLPHILFMCLIPAIHLSRANLHSRRSHLNSFNRGHDFHSLFGAWCFRNIHWSAECGEYSISNCSSAYFVSCHFFSMSSREGVTIGTAEMREDIGFADGVAKGCWFAFCGADTWRRGVARMEALAARDWATFCSSNFFCSYLASFSCRFF